MCLLGKCKRPQRTSDCLSVQPQLQDHLMLEIQTPDLHVLLLPEIHYTKVKHMKPFLNKALKSIQ